MDSNRFNKVKLSSGEVLLYSGHDRENAPHTAGVGIMISKTAGRLLIDWKPVSSRIITARFYTKVQKVTVVLRFNKRCRSGT